MPNINHSPLLNSDLEKNCAALPSCEKWCGEDEYAQRCYVFSIAASIEFWLLVAGAVASQWWMVLSG